MKNKTKINYLLVSDIPTPWREKVYENVYNYFGDAFHVVYCAHNEKRRLWKFPFGVYKKSFLKSLRICIGDKERWLGLGIVPLLLKNRPEVVICFSLQPTVILTLLLAKLLKIKIGILSDTWIGKDRGISKIQILTRKIIFRYFCDAFIGASVQSLKLYKSFNKKYRNESLFLSWLCADNDYFKEYINKKPSKKEFDLMFSGRIVDIKNPIFFANVASLVKQKMGSCKVLIIGDGDKALKDYMFKILDNARVEYSFVGFIEHNKLPEYYSKARILLLPTSEDCWGVVLNEALVSGVPVVTTNKTAAAGELVINEENGYILPIDEHIWAAKIYSLLTDKKKYKDFSICAVDRVKKFNFNSAADGLREAINYLKEIKIKE